MRISTSILWLVGGTGSVLIAAAQTPPKEATSNIGGWFDLIGKAPDFLLAQNADHWVTVLGFVLVAAPVGYTVIRRRRLKVSKDGPIPSDNIANQPFKAGEPAPLERRRGLHVKDVEIEDCDVGIAIGENTPATVERTTIRKGKYGIYVGPQKGRESGNDEKPK